MQKYADILHLLGEKGKKRVLPQGHREKKLRIGNCGIKTELRKIKINHVRRHEEERA